MGLEWNDLNPLSWPGQVKSALNKSFGSPADDDLNSLMQQGRPYAFMGQNPYQKNYDQLIGMLTGRANGTNSLADQQYKQAHDNSLRTQLMLGSGRSPGAARQASLNMAGLDQGLAQGLATAGIQERNSAMAGLGSAIGGASQADYMRNYANQQAYLQALQARLGTPTGTDKAMQAAMAAAGMAAKGG